MRTIPLMTLETTMEHKMTRGMNIVALESSFGQTSAIKSQMGRPYPMKIYTGRKSGQ